MKKSVYAHNERAFGDVISSRETAYWAGFLMADGGLVKASKHLWRLSVTLQRRDEPHLQKLRYFLSCDAPIRRERRVRKVTNKGASPLMYSSLSLACSDLACDLIALGVTPRKSFTAAAADSLVRSRDFWRGVIDGDGCLMLSRINSARDGPSKRLIASLTLCSASRVLITQFRDFVKEAIGGNRRPRRVGPHTRALSIAVGDHQAYRLIRALYEGAPVALDRKAGKAALIMRTYRDHVPVGHHSKEERDAWVRDYLAGDTLRTLNKRYRVKTEVLFAEFDARGVRKTYFGAGKVTRQETRRAVTAYRKGLTAKEVAEQFGWSYDITRRVLRRAGVEFRPPNRDPSVPLHARGIHTLCKHS